MLKDWCLEARHDLAEIIASLPLDEAQVYMATAHEAPVDAYGEINWLELGDKAARQLGRPESEYPSNLLAFYLDRWLTAHQPW